MDMVRAHGNRHGQRIDISLQVEETGVLGLANRKRGTMPAKSQKQRAWAYGVKGKKWAKSHHFNNKGKLPKRSRRKKK